MSRFTVEVDLQREPIAGLAGDERRWASTGRAARPACAGLEAWPPIRWAQSGVDFVGCFCPRARRAGDGRCYQLKKWLSVRWTSGWRCRARIRRVPSSFSVLMKRSITAMLPCWPTAPYRGRIRLRRHQRLKSWHQKMLSLSQTRYFGVAWPGRLSSQDGAHRERLGPLRKGGTAHRAPGVVIDDHGQPPTERPALREREGQPGSPETCARGHGGQVDVPDVVRVLGGRHPVCRASGFRRYPPWRLLEDPPDGRRADVHASTAQHPAILALPRAGHRALRRCTAYRTKSGNLLTGSWV